jgi:hypothetical protein
LAERGVVLTLDSIIAFGIMTVIISSLIFIRIEAKSPYLTSQQLHSSSEDILTVLSNSELGDVVDQAMLDDYIASGILNQSDLSKKTLEVIGALWAAQKDEEAKNITKNILNNFVPSNIGYQLVIDGNDIYNSSDTARPQYQDSEIMISSRRIVSGYEKYKPVSGFVARAWATKITKTVTKIIPMNLVWGEYSDQRYWYNGYAPQEIRDQNEWAAMRKNFTIPNDANISYAYMQLALDNDYTRVFINGNNVFDDSGLRGVIRELDITDDVVPGLNQIEMEFKNSGNDLAHFHPGSFIKLKYNTSEIESGTNKTIFNASQIRGVPSANEIIPFFVNTPITNVTAFVEVEDINAFLLLTLNYKYDPSDPLKNVLLYREYETNSCSEFSSQENCEASPQCFWNTSLQNVTVFYDDFESWSTSYDCSFSSDWTNCLDTSDSYIRGSYTSANSSRSLTTYDWDSDDFPASEALIKCLDLSHYSKAYLTFWWRKYGLDSGEYGRIDINDGSGWVNIWDSGTGSSSGFSESQINITDYTSHNTCIGIHLRASRESEWVNYDDLRIIGTAEGACESSETEIKDRSYEIFFNETGTLIRELNSTGSLLNEWLNNNVTINNIYNNMTNTLGIYADIRPPVNDTVVGTSDVDWQRLGMYAHDETAGHGSDYFCYITDKSNVTLYHVPPEYGLEYGKIDITAVQNFTTDEKLCVEKDVWSCKDANLNFSFNFSTDIILSRVIGTQTWGGMDNGYNFIWIWSEGDLEEENLALDLDTPPGTFAYLPVDYFETDKINYVRVGDKDADRYLNTEVSSLMNSRRSMVEYTFTAPSQVGYGDIFETENEATTDAENRLNQLLGEHASATLIQKDVNKVSGVPYMWGPVDVRLNVWV